MYSQDFIRRQIGQATAVLLEALGLKTVGRFADAHQAIEQALGQLFAMRKDLSDRLDDESLLNILVVNDELDLERLAACSDLYRLDGEVLAEMSQPAPAALANLRALRFFLELALSDCDNLTAELAGKITDLQKKLKGYVLPSETQLALEDYEAALQEKRGGESSVSA